MLPLQNILQQGISPLEQSGVPFRQRVSCVTDIAGGALAFLGA